MKRKTSQRPLAVSAAVLAILAGTALSARAQQPAIPLPADGGAAEATYELPQGAGLGAADLQVKKLSEDGARALDELVGQAVSSERELNDIEARSEDQRIINTLEMKLEQAKLAKELHETLNDDEEKALEAVTLERDQLRAQIKALEEQLTSTAKRLRAQSVDAAEAAPVIVGIAGSNGDLTARLLVPYSGEVVVRRGDTLSDGSRVVSITARGVSVSKDGATRELAFGTAVPARR